MSAEETIKKHAEDWNNWHEECRKQVLAAMEEYKNSTWIESKDRLPEYGKEVLVWGGAQPELAFYKGVWVASDEDDTYSSIEYWMPLPEKPKNKII